MRFSAIIALALASVASAAPIVTNGTVTAPTGGGDLITTYTHCNRPGVFALTFDDGPFQYSWDLAKFLHSKNVKATFFTNGDNFVKGLRNASTTTSDGPKSYIDVLKYYHELGHEIASHTYQHLNLVGLSEEQVQFQMNQQSDLIFDAIGQRPALMRPPEGQLDDDASRVLKNLGYSNIMWDVDTKDYELKGLFSEEALVRGVVDNDVPGQTPGHISLQHDVHEASAKELTPWMIDYITSKNYTFVTVSDCLGIPAYQ
jgi:peptidoglycan/xylan/chitin deacetylase (PgdA/CDA1 family)